MPSEKALAAFPPEYHALFSYALERERTSVSCASYREAHNMRNDLYAYRRALRREAPERYVQVRPLILSIKHTPGEAKAFVIFRKPRDEFRRKYREAINDTSRASTLPEGD